MLECSGRPVCWVTPDSCKSNLRLKEKEYGLEKEKNTKQKSLWIPY